MVLLLKEYLSSGDIAEATRCLQDLEVPHFHHELVYEVSFSGVFDISAFLYNRKNFVVILCYWHVGVRRQLGFRSITEFYYLDPFQI